MLLKTACLVVIFGFTLSLAERSEPSFSEGQLKLNKLTKPLRVLALFPYKGYSHFIVFKALMLGLANRGHSVTVISPFPLKSPIENYRDIDLSQMLVKVDIQSRFEDTVARHHADVFSKTRQFARLSSPALCRDVLKHPEVAKILQQKNQFDVVFTEVFGSDCLIAVGHVLQVPVINMVTSSTILWMNDYVGETTHPAIVPTHFLRHGQLDTVWKRLQNTYFSIASKIAFYFQITRPSEAVLREVFGENIPSLAELRHNVSLVMTNTHPSIFGAKPTVPRVLEVAGIHLQPADPRKLPQDIRDWLDTAPNGVLFFSLGSVVNGDTLPAHLRTALVEAFAEMKPLRVLWKFEKQEKFGSLPDNVKVADWLPQVEILNHPNLLAFMTHAGAMGVIEAVYYGVPMVGIPIFADQETNTNALVKLGCAVYLDHKNMAKENILQAVAIATTDPTMRRRAKEVSRVFRDRPMSPVDTAIWWTEYVARHGGAPHLESPTARMPFWQYALLDVAALGILLALIVFIIPLMTILYLKRFLARKHVEKKQSSKKKR